MSYCVQFDDKFTFDRPLNSEHFLYLRAFSLSRHVTYGVTALATVYDPLRVFVGLPIGDAGTFCTAFAHDSRKAAGVIVDDNTPPPGVPSLWCNWTPTDDAQGLYADGEKFEEYLAWLEWLIDNLFKRWGYVLNGAMNVTGDYGDEGAIVVEDNKVQVCDHV